MRNKCNWCGRSPTSCQEHVCVSEQTKLTLIDWISEHGYQWRARLRDAWMNGGSDLRQLRNSVGPSLLTHVNPSKSETQELLSVVGRQL